MLISKIISVNTAYQDTNNYDFNTMIFINGKSRLIIVGDQFIPPVVGAKGDCCLVLRVNQGNFNEMKDLFFFKFLKGLNLLMVV